MLDRIFFSSKSGTLPCKRPEICLWTWMWGELVFVSYCEVIEGELYDIRNEVVIGDLMVTN